MTSGAPCSWASVSTSWVARRGNSGGTNPTASRASVSAPATATASPAAAAAVESRPPAIASRQPSATVA